MWIIGSIALVVLAPELFFGLTVTDNFRFNLIWPEQFNELFRAGNLYPRWLPRSWDGFGSPVFYFYPPLSFWVTATADAVTGGLLPTHRLVPIGTLILLFISGLGMRAWLKLYAADGTATWGAAAYVLAPYHLYDIYCRGALAEASAYALLPLIMLAIARLAAGSARYCIFLALSYAALLFAHLPSALLITLFLVAPYAVFLLRKSAAPGRFTILMLLGGALGVGLAAIYIVPALLLLKFVSPQGLSGSFYQPTNWAFWNFPASPMGMRMLFIIPVSIAAGLLALAVYREPRGHSGDARFWAGLTLFLVCLIAGVIPGVWKIPGLELVQFPWRALLLAEFAIITAIAASSISFRKPLAIAGALVLLVSYILLGKMIGHTLARTMSEQAQTAREIRAQYLDAPEYLPAGSNVAQGEGPDDVRIQLPSMPLVQAVGARVSVMNAGGATMTFRVEADSETEVVLRRFHFPTWQIVNARGDQVVISKHAPAGTVSIRVPPGTSLYQLRQQRAPSELVASLISRAAALLLLFFTLFGALRNRRTARAPHGQK